MRLFLNHKRSGIHQKLFLFFSVLIVVTLPFSVKLNSLAIFLLTLNWIIEGGWNAKMELLKNNRFGLLMIVFFAYHIIGLVYTGNLKQGAFELEKRIASLLIPLVFTSSAQQLSKKTIEKILTAFVISCTLAAAVCSVNAIYYFIQGDSSYLYYHKLGSPIHFDHAVYFSLYIAFTVFIILTFLIRNWNEQTSIFRMTLLFTSFYLFVFLIFLSSKTIIVSTFVLFVILACMHLRRQNIIKVAALSILGFGILVSILINNGAIKERFEEVIVDKYDQVNPLFLDDYQGYHFTGGAIRLAIWKIIIGIVNENKAWVQGVGTGDTQDVLTASYITKHVYPGDESVGAEGFLSYNAHNQFFQFYLSLGMIGLTLFLYILFFLWKRALVDTNYYLISMLFFFTTFCFTESVLCTQKGIVFFSLFASLFMSAVYLNSSSQYVVE